MFLRKFAQQASRLIYFIILAIALPFLILYSLALRNSTPKLDVLHVSLLSHVPWRTTRALRNNGIHADYFSCGTDKYRSLSDYSKPALPFALTIFYEIYYFIKKLRHYSVVHLHFGLTTTEIGWDIICLKVMNRKIIVHFRGCEARDRVKNFNINPEINICQECDYNASLCSNSLKNIRRDIIVKLSDNVLVTTPDMLDFYPTATVSSFFAPINTREYYNEITWNGTGCLKILHVTNHPGIEGTAHITKVVDELKREGYNINLKFLSNVDHIQVLDELKTSHVTIGKMKMGFYANFQIESLTFGVPAITWIRPALRTKELEDSGLIISSLADLKDTIREIYHRPDLLLIKKNKSKSSVEKLHGEARISKIYRDIY